MQRQVLRHEDYSGRDDAALVELARQGEEGAIRTLIKRNNQRLFRVARSVLRNDTDSEDVVQETYVRAFTHLDQFRGEAKFSTWLTRIALNAALGRRRGQRPTVSYEATIEQPGGELIMFPSGGNPTQDPESELGRRQARLLIERALAELPEIFRTVFVMRDVEGMSIEETAELLAIKPQTVKTRLFRARKLVREGIDTALAPAFGDIFPFDGMRCARLAERVMARLKAIA
jgi:RNA polymerase sigma-70 factor (ECF subfamily)